MIYPLVSLIDQLGLVYLLLFAWAGFTVYYLRKEDKNPYLLQIIPSIFTTLGVFGTFIGISYGLYNFQTDDIQKSIPELLDGMKTAFGTSILGIFASVLASWFISKQNQILEQAEANQSPEVLVLREISKNLSLITTQQNQQFQLQLEVEKRQKVESDKQANHLLRLEKNFSNLEQALKDLANMVSTVGLEQQINQDKNLSDILKELKLQTLQKNKTHEQLDRVEQRLSKEIINVNETIKTNNEKVKAILESFKKVLQEANTEAIMQAMKSMITSFDEKMRDILERLVKKNFEELNNSVQMLNTWQQEHKQQVETLTKQFNQVTQNLDTTAKQLKSITEMTEELTKQNSVLSQLVNALKKAMIDEPKFEILVNKTSNNIETLSKMTEAFDGTTQKLNQWISREHGIKESTVQLIKELEKIQPTAGEFWKNTKTEMEKAISIFSNGNNRLEQEIGKMNAEFYVRLSNTLTELDKLIAQFIINSKKPK